MSKIKTALFNLVQVFETGSKFCAPVTFLKSFKLFRTIMSVFK